MHEIIAATLAAGYLRQASPYGDKNVQEEILVVVDLYEAILTELTRRESTPSPFADDQALALARVVARDIHITHPQALARLQVAILSEIVHAGGSERS